MKRPALFLDRDGVINVDYGYVHLPEKFEFLPGIFDLVKQANFLGYWVVVVTNQAGIGRGYYTENQFHDLTNWMLDKFKANEALVDKVYYCPYHPIFGIGKYRINSDCRKPNPGMLLQARDDLNIDMAHSIMLGDKQSDMEAASAAGIKTLLCLSNKKINYNCVCINKLNEAFDHLNI